MSHKMKQTMTIRRCVFPAVTICVVVLIFISTTKKKSNAQSNESKFQTIHVYQQEEKEDPGSNSLRIWSYDNQHWNRNWTVCEGARIDYDGLLKSPYGDIPMSIYNPKNDVWISRRIAMNHEFDGKKRDLILHILQEDNKLNFIDFGCNIGVYTLTVAKMGRKALCIDALDLNVQHVCASLRTNLFQNKVDIILNAVSSAHQQVQLAVDFKNMGGTFVDNDADFVKKIKGKTVSGKHYSNVSTILVNDLLSLPMIDNFQKVFIKMDIEGFEARALERADEFFNKVYVKGILMEWIFHRGTTSGLNIVNFMSRHRYQAHSPKSRRLLPHSPNGAWPGQDILWLKL